MVKGEKMKTLKIIILFLIFNLSISNSQVWEELINLSDIALNNSKSDSAANYLEQALSVAIKEGPAKHAVTLNRLGNLYFTKGQPEKAYEYYITGKNLERTIFGKAHPLYAKSLNNISVCLMLLGRYPEAESNLKEDMEIKKALYGTNDTNYAKTLHNLAKLYHTLGKYQDAEQLYNEALKIKNAHAGKGSILSANTSLNLGMLYSSLYNYQEASEQYNQALNNYKQILGEDALYTNLTLIQLALMNESSGNSSEADEYINRIHLSAISQSNTNMYSTDLTTILSDYGLLLIKKGKLPEAEKILNQALKLIEKQLGKTSSSYSSCLNAIGICYSMQGKNEQALKYFNQVATLREVFFGESHPEYSTALFNIAYVYDCLKQPEQAEQYYIKGIEATQNLAMQFFPFLSESEKEFYYNNLRYRYDLFNNFALNRIKEKPEIASLMYDFHLATEDILLNNTIKLRNIIEESQDTELLSLFETWKKLRTEMTGIVRLSKNELKTGGYNSDSISKLINTTEKQLSIKTNAYGLSLFNQKISYKDIQEHLAENEAAVEIIKFETEKNSVKSNCYVALIIKNQSLHPDYVLIDKDNVLESKAIKNYQNSIRANINDNDSYNFFWAPIAEKLKDIRKIYISLDGIYHKVNLASIMAPDNKYLLEKYEFINLNSTSGIINLKKNPDKFAKSAALFGNPSFSDKPDKSEQLLDYNKSNTLKKEMKTLKFANLPGTAKEIELIKDILSKSGFEVVANLSGDASKTNLMRLKNKSILHIATHGYFLTDDSKELGLLQLEENRNPMFRSGMVLKGADHALSYTGYIDNGILSSYEVANLNLTRSELVVLSACETGLGEIKNGEGVYGLRRAFQIAGAKNLIMSLWKVNDEATQHLFVSFYRFLVNGKDADSALKEAQLELIKDYPNPYYWGSFILVRN